MLFEVSRADICESSLHRSHFSCVVGAEICNEGHVAMKFRDVRANYDEKENWYEFVLIPEMVRNE